MQTTCPECRTTFRVSQEHLGARRGLVRCGTCTAVFNAYDTLLPELETPPGDVRPEAVVRDIERVAPGAESVSNLDLGAEMPSEPLPAQPEAILTDLPPEPEVDTVTLSSSAKAPGEKASGAPQDDILLQDLWPQRPEKAKARAWSWRSVSFILLAILLVGLLLLQAAYFLRAELAAAVPLARPALEFLCRPLRCHVPLPQQLTQDAIAASSLEHDPENKSRVRLALLLTNRTGQTQAWPRIMLTLSDVREAPVAQQMFRPRAYLPKTVKVSDGIAAGAEHEIRLDLDIGNLVASGYALKLAYP